MRKLLSVLLSLSLLATLSLTAYSTDISSQSRLFEFLELSEAQKPASDAHKALYNSFLSENSATEVYPLNYGGDYIDGTTLHVCIVDLPNQDITPYENILEPYMDYVVFENVDYSLQTLLDASDEIATALTARGVPVAGTGINEPNNAVLVQIEPNKAKTAVLSLRQYSDNKNPNTLDAILYEAKDFSFSVPTLFREGPAMTPAVELMGGDALSGYTLGMCGTYNNEPAIAMCGHGLSRGSSVKYQADSSTIGTVRTMRYADGSDGDYAVVEITNSSFTTSNMVGDPSLPSSQVEITDTIDRPATGLAVIKYGKNGGYAYGNVSESNYVWRPSGMTTGVGGIVNVRISSGRVVSGDSGGPIFTAFGEFCGTVSGTAASDNYGFSHYAFSPYIYHRNAGFTALTG